MVSKVFIDGAAGTTGLEIRERLAGRAEFSLVQLSDAQRKDPTARAAALNDAEIVILCLPDEAARDAVGMIDNPRVRVIDASTAHRVAPGWTYGFPELEPDQRSQRRDPDDRSDDAHDDHQQDRDQHVVPELGPADAAVEIDVVVRDRVLEILPDLVEIHLHSPREARPHR